MSRAAWFTADRATDWRGVGLATTRQGDVAAEIADDAQSIVIKRGTTTLAAQSVRILGLTWPPRGDEAGSAGGEEAGDEVVVLGGASLNIQRSDRFAVGAQWYVVEYVAPEQENRVEAKARQMQ